ncbi:MAG: hypothetical protein ACI9D5_000504 [Candidatus Endobugula sp.]
MAPKLIPAIRRQVERANAFLQEDITYPDYSGVWLPDALARKYRNASKELGWQHLFPSYRLSIEPGTSNVRRHHIDESTLN